MPTKSLSDRLIGPQSCVAGDVVVLLVLYSSTDVRSLSLDSFGVVSDELECLHGFFYAVLLDVPARAFGAEPYGWNDDRWR